MAITDAYFDAATYRGVIDKSDTGEDVEILGDAAAVTRYLEQRLQRTFNRDVANTVRVYMPEAADSRLYIEDLVTVSSIKIDEDADGSFADETALAATDYELTPRNAALGAEPRPYTAIELTSWGTKGLFTPGARVEVTGIHGWPAVPEAVKRAAIHLTAILRLETPRVQATVSELGQLVQSSPQARGIIDELIRWGYRRMAL